MLETQLFLILCGSSMSFMENQVLGYKSPLYGRRTARLRITALDYLDGARFLPSWNPDDKLIAYGITGGIPQYLRLVAGASSLQEAIVEQFLTPSGALFEEPMNPMRQEMREPALYNTIIAAIAQGASRQNQVSTRIGEPPNKTAKYLKALLDLEIVAKEQPYGEDSSHKSIYRVADLMFAFWYRFVLPHISAIQTGVGEEVWRRHVRPSLPENMGPAFESICRQYMERRNRAGSLPDLFDGFGRWWGPDPVRKRQEEIDIVGASGKTAVFGECEWRSEKTGPAELETLRSRSLLLTAYRERSYFLFSRSGFADSLIREAETMKDVSLVDRSDLFDGT